MNELIYLYCISDSLPDPGFNQGQDEIQVLTFGTLNVFVKYVPKSEFSEENLKKNLADIIWLEGNARNHVKVINQLMLQINVMPFNFGTIYTEEEHLKKFVTEYSEKIIQNFNIIKDKEEWSVKIYCDRKELSEKIDELSEISAELEKQIMASSPGKAFLLRRKKTEMVETEMDRLCKFYGQKYYNAFESVSEITSINNLLPKEYTGRTDTMILNAAFLVFRSNVSEFLKTMNDLKKSDECSGFKLETSGPWPPFSFISIK